MTTTDTRSDLAGRLAAALRELLDADPRSIREIGDLAPDGAIDTRGLYRLTSDPDRWRLLVRLGDTLTAAGLDPAELLARAAGDRIGVDPMTAEGAATLARLDPARRRLAVDLLAVLDAHPATSDLSDEDRALLDLARRSPPDHRSLMSRLWSEDLALWSERDGSDSSGG